MDQKIKILDNFEVFFQTLGDSLQTRVTVLSTEFFDDTSLFRLIEPGRTILIGDIEPELLRLFTAVGRPTLNEKTATTSRPGGVFSTRAYDALRLHLFGDNLETAEPRVRPGKRTKKQPVFRDLPQPA